MRTGAEVPFGHPVPSHGSEMEAGSSAAPIRVRSGRGRPVQRQSTSRRRLGFRIRQPARERVFLTPSEKAEFSAPPLPDVVPPPGRLTLSTVRSHDQWNTTIYSDDDRYRGLKNLRTALFMNAEDMRDRGLAEFDLIDITSFARDGSTRSVYGYRAVAYNTPRGSVFGYMPELNVLCAIADHSGQSGQPLTKQLIVEVTPAGAAPDPHLTAAHDR
ncbi:MAG: molybdopterin-dependent oxidoreductase alpha subunit [Mycobacterium sp.]|jgi:anaerobic selenocysteine-containing dehydrogenase|nr:molybdopterin-dependent oxidoreductase alpha subunit [Mycobacterium sp.]